MRYLVLLLGACATVPCEVSIPPQPDGKPVGRKQQKQQKQQQLHQLQQKEEKQVTGVHLCNVVSTPPEYILNLCWSSVGSMVKTGCRDSSFSPKKV